MGSWGEYFVVRTDRSILDLPLFIEPRSCRKDHGDVCFGPEWTMGEWRVLWVYHGIAGTPDDNLARLVAESGAPSLTAYVYDSDTAFVRAADGASAGCDAWLKPRAAAHYVLGEESDCEMLTDEWHRTWKAIEARLRTEAPERAHSLCRWAASAGLAPDFAAVLDTLLSDEPGFAEDRFLDLLKALGLRTDEAVVAGAPR